MPDDFQLHLYTPATEGAPSPIMPINGISEYQRSVRLNGGYWDGSFRIDGPETELIDWMEYLGYHVEEYSNGATTWEGLIYEIELNVGNIPRRISLDAFANQVWVQYDDARTSSASVAASQTKYGIKQEIIDLQNATQTEAENLRDTYLTRYGWPRAYPYRSVSMPGTPHIIVYLRGYVSTLNWKFASLTDSTQTASAFITDLITNDSQFITAGRIDTNALDLVIEADIADNDKTPAYVWDVIAREILPLGDSSQNIWRFYVDEGRKAFYHQLDMTPIYHMRNGGVRYASGEAVTVSPFWITPGVFRDLNYPLQGQESGSIFQDVRDFIVDEVVVSQTGGVSLRSMNYQADDFINAFDTFMDLTSDGGTTSTVIKWYWPDMSPEEQQWYIDHGGDMSGYPG